MRFQLPYGHHQKVEFDVPDRSLAFYAERKKMPPVADVHHSVIEALKRPMGTPPLGRIARKGDEVIVLVDDLTRPTPQTEILPTVLEELCSNGVSPEEIEIIIGLGTHRPMTDAEVVDHLGPEVAERFTVTNHDYKDDKKLVNLGTTELGIPALVNKTVVDADLVISMGNIVPHNAAG
jgi:nickel-dependent lactate racemase